MKVGAVRIQYCFTKDDQNYSCLKYCIIYFVLDLHVRRTPRHYSLKQSRKHKENLMKTLLWGWEMPQGPKRGIQMGSETCAIILWGADRQDMKYPSTMKTNASRESRFFKMADQKRCEKMLDRVAPTHHPPRLSYLICLFRCTDIFLLVSNMFAQRNYDLVC